MNRVSKAALNFLFIQFFVLGLVDAQVLTHGPVVGGVTSASAQVFIRTDKATTVSLRWSTDPNLTTYQVSQTYSTDSSSDFTKTIPLTGLPAETAIYLNPVVNGVPQFTVAPYPTFSTFPILGTQRTFNFVVLTDFATTYTLTEDIQTFTHASAESPVFAFIGGDFDHRNPANITGKRVMFQSLYDPNTPHMGGFASLILRRMPIVHQWDDHDAGRNNLDKTFPGWPITQQAFQEYIPSYPLPAVSPGIWQKFSYAQMDAFVLDCRSQRDPENDVDDANKSMLDGNNLGATGELQWLKDGLLGSTATWKVIFTSVITNPTTKVPDGWGGYQTEWNALRDFINSNNIQNVVFISGDLHLDAIDNGTASGFPEMCVAPPGGITPGDHCSTDAPGIWSEGYYEGLCAGYGVVSVMQNPDRLLLQAVDQFGTRQVTYTVAAATPTPTPTATPTPTPTPTATPTPTPGSPVITTQPSDATVNVGNSARFKVVATGNPPLHYQWQKNGQDIAGATKANYTTPPTTSTDDGALFSVVVSNSIGSATSNNAKLTVVSTIAPAITGQPSDRAVSVGQRAKFRVVATGTPPLSYQWRKNGTDIAGANSSSYSTPPTTLDDNGALFSVVVSNAAGSVTSRDALLSVQ
ncbi:MAG TPA: alkaline phosphatase D family protein [Chthoniobacterales bacterium]|jgi:alkaline phosphatase D